jgi:Flp pilus assembly protein TadD
MRFSFKPIFPRRLEMRTTLIRALRLSLSAVRAQSRTGAIVVFVLLALSVAPAFAQSVVKGKVVDAQGKPVEGATVTFESQGTNAKRDTKTDKKGEFLQVGLASGAWKVTAAKEGVGTQSQTGNVSQGRPVELAFKLAPAAPGVAGGGDPKAAAELQAAATAAQTAMQAGKYDEAITQLQTIAAKVPTCADCYSSIGTAYAAQKKYSEAEAAYKKSIELKPENGEAYNGLVKIYNDQKKFDLAAEAGANAAKYSGGGTAGGGNPEAMYNQGVVLFNAGKFTEAKTQFESASKADPNMALAHYYLGMASLNGGDLPGATAAFEAYLKLDPDGSKIPASSPVKVNELKAFLASQKK